MTNPDSQAGPEATLPSNDAAAADKPAGTSAGKGPRRATAPAGSPAKTAVTAPALLVISADGMIVPTSPASPAGAGNNEAGKSPAEVAEAAKTDTDSTVDLIGVEGTRTEAAGGGIEDSASASASAKKLSTTGLPAEDESVGAEIAITAPATDHADAAAVVGDKDTPSIAEDSALPASTALEVPDEAETTVDAGPEEASESAAGPATAAVAAAVAREKPNKAESPNAGTPDGEAESPITGTADGGAGTAEAAALASDASGDEGSSPLSDDNQTDTAQSDATPADTTTEDQAPLSRRERRLAEQRLDSGVEPGASAPPMLSADDPAAGPATGTAKTGTAAAAKETSEPDDTTDSDSAARAARRPTPVKKRNRFVAFIRGLFFLVVISALVVGMGTVLTGNEEAAVGPSQTEQHRQAAWDATIALLAQSKALANSTDDSKTREVLNRTVKDLEVQAAALGDGLPPNTATPTPTATTGTPPTAAQLALALTTNGGELLDSSLTAEHAMGGVFAAAGTSQLLLGQNLSTAAGSTPPATTFLPARIDFPAPDGPPCKSTLEPRPGATIDAALRAAALAEQKAVYAYQVSTTRFAEPQFSKSADLLERHQAKLAVLNTELQVRCLPLATTVAGFSLDPTFTTTPKIALAGLEAELSGVYADLAALSTALPDDAAATAAPGAAAAATPAPANTTMLREISVTWLLDSAQAQLGWGGTPPALAGMPAESTPAGPATP